MAIKRLEAVWKFLQAARNLVKNKNMSKEGILRFAKQEFGEVSDFLRLQIDNLFRKPKVLTSADKTYKQELKRLEGALGSLDPKQPGFKQAADRLIKKIEDLKNTKKADVVPIKKKVDLSKYDDEALNRLVDEDIMLRGEADTLSDFGKDYGRIKEIEKRRKEIREILEAAQKNPELVGGAKEGIMSQYKSIDDGLTQAEKDAKFDNFMADADRTYANFVTKALRDIQKASKSERQQMIKAIKNRTGMFRYLDDADAEKILKSVDETKKGDVVSIKKKTEAEKDIADIQKSIDDLDAAEAEADAFSILDDRTRDIAKGDVEGKGIESLETSVKKIKEAAEELKKSTIKPENIMEQIVKGQRVMAEGYKTGNIRTAVRWFMRQEADAGRLKLKKWDDEALKVYGQTTESDPINIFRRYYGEDALDAVDEIGDVFSQGESFNHYAELLRKNVDSSILTPKTRGLGQYDESVVAGEKLRKAKEQEAKNLKILEDFKPDREPSAHGGIIGNLRLNRKNFQDGTEIDKEIKKYANIFAEDQTIIDQTGKELEKKLSKFIPDETEKEKEEREMFKMVKEFQTFKRDNPESRMSFFMFREKKKKEKELFKNAIIKLDLKYPEKEIINKEGFVNKKNLKETIDEAEADFEISPIDGLTLQRSVNTEGEQSVTSGSFDINNFNFTSPNIEEGKLTSSADFDVGNLNLLGKVDSKDGDILKTEYGFNYDDILKAKLSESDGYKEAEFDLDKTFPISDKFDLNLKGGSDIMITPDDETYKSYDLTPKLSYDGDIFSADVSKEIMEGGDDFSLNAAASFPLFQETFAGDLILGSDGKPIFDENGMPLRKSNITKDMGVVTLKGTDLFTDDMGGTIGYKKEFGNRNDDLFFTVGGEKNLFDDEYTMGAGFKYIFSDGGLANILKIK